MNLDPKRMPMDSSTFVTGRKVRQTMCSFDRKLLEDLHRFALLLRNIQELMRLQTELPAGMLQAVTQCQLCILFAFSAVHWLKKEVLKIKLLVQFRACTVLRENEFEFMSGAKP